MYHRTNLTMRRLGFLPALEPMGRPSDAGDRLWIVDGTPVPVRDRSVAACGRNCRFSANVQVIVDPDIRLVIAAPRPVPGTSADTRAWRASGPSRHRESVTVRATVPTSTAEWRCDTQTPRAASAQAREDDDAEHRRVRPRVEHVIGRLRNNTVLRDCRRRGDGLHHAVQALAGMHNLALAS
ncbi:transposase family protein [Streptomyces sp. NPDC059224]|uniref:transposase family protein n=1 Tax=Streptomyces sp. NPDC059224 TaxID=3346775 RepID=UPI0036BB121E